MFPFYHKIDCFKFMNRYVTVASLGLDVTGNIAMGDLNNKVKFGRLTKELLKGTDKTVLYALIMSNQNLVQNLKILSL